MEDTLLTLVVRSAYFLSSPIYFKVAGLTAAPSISSRQIKIIKQNYILYYACPLKFHIFGNHIWNRWRLKCIFKRRIKGNVTFSLLKIIYLLYKQMYKYWFLLGFTGISRSSLAFTLCSCLRSYFCYSSFSTWFC